jgi:hypothetical protein
MDYKRDRDLIVALLALGAAIADPEMAQGLDLSGIEQKDLRDFANAVRTMQHSDSAEADKDAAQHIICRFLAGIAITRSSKISVRQQIQDAANEWALACRALQWAKRFFQPPFLRPRGSRREVIAKLREYGFKDEVQPTGQGRPRSMASKYA